jgi:large subunit ribosomal protein L25
MAQDIVLTVQAREGRGRSDVRKLRAEGLLPGVIYGAGIEPVALSVPRSELLRVLHAHGAHPLVTVKVDGGPDAPSGARPIEYLALIKDLQIDHVKQTALHVDFHRVQEDKPVQTEVEVHLEGTPEGVKTGGILDVTTRLVAIEALPRELPEAIYLDVSAMQLGDVRRVSDLTPPPGVTILTDPDETLASVVAPRVEVPELTPEEAEALAALSPDELEALKELVAEAPEAAAQLAEPEEPAEAGGGGEPSEAPEGE